ncbi:hypothetical protein HKCCE2091_18425 [Rhodobacterales bacterium HKCCE2091]|nr:hypothetical protein [Rhodobacterales bacterium HKCCE2091]
MRRSRRDRRNAAPNAPAPVAAETSVPGLGSKDRKPRLLVAGEFSAGKTRLITGLLKDDVLPSNVTATALPPVWLVSGAPGIAAVDMSGIMSPVESLDAVTVENTQYCVISHPAEILKHVEIIDTPGSSDPNIPIESWEKMLGYADTAIWCTNATQAWRQSEKSVWKELPEHLVGDATLVVTHADRMASAETADRVMRRVRREARDFFRHFRMASLVSEDDVAGIADHILSVILGQTELVGENNSKVASFAREQEKALAATAEPAGVSITPRRALADGATGIGDHFIDQDGVARLEEDDAAEIVPGDTGELSGAAEVFELPPRAREESKAPEGFRKFWDLLSRNVDFDDSAAVIDCIEDFVGRLEQATDDELLEIASAGRNGGAAELTANGN